MQDQNNMPEGKASRKLARRDFLRVSAAGFASAAAAAFAAACAPMAAPPAAAPTAAAGAATVAAPTVVSGAPLTIKLLSSWWVDAGFEKQLRAVVSKFHESQNDIRIEEVAFPSNQFPDAVKAQMASGKLDADVINMLPGLEVPLLQGGFLAPLNSVATNAGITEYIPYTSVPGFLREGDNVYGLAPNIAVDGLIYNSEIFEKAGITEMPKTQDEMYELAKSLTNRPDQFGYAVRHTVAEKVGFIRDMIPWVLGYDGAFAEGKTPTINAAPMISVLTMWRKMYEAAFPQGAAAADYRRMMATGLLAMNTDNNAVVPTFFGLDEKSKEFVTSAPLPWANHKGAAFSSYNGLVPSGDTAKEQASAAFLEFWFKPDNFKTWNWEILAPPMVPEANTQEYLDSLPWMGGFSTTVPVHNAVVYGDFFPFVDEFRTILIKHASEVVVGTVTPEEGAAAAQTELEEMAQRVFS